MHLRPLTEGKDFELAASWLQRESVSKWLDSRTLAGPPSPVVLKAIAQRGAHVIRLFALGPEGPPIGLVALSDVHPEFRTGTLWYVLGELGYEQKGMTTQAVSVFLHYIFEHHGVEAVNAWAVDANVASIRVLEKNGFRYIGRQRSCHYVDGQPHDRLLYDLLANECVVR